MENKKEELDPRLHFVVVTGIIVKGDKFLIMKRAAHEKAFPNKWTVPGGKLVYHEYSKIPYKTKYPQINYIVDDVRNVLTYDLQPDIVLVGELLEHIEDTQQFLDFFGEFCRMSGFQANCQFFITGFLQVICKPCPTHSSMLFQNQMIALVNAFNGFSGLLIGDTY